MESIFHGHSRKSGVYKIYNKLNGRIYIGSAKELKNRFRGHLYSLRVNKHSNKYLQNDFNKCGSENFVFEVIEVVSGDDRFLIEQLHIDKFFDKQDLCYNFKKEAIQKDRSCFSLTPEDTSKKISDAVLKRWVSLTDEEREIKLQKVKELGYKNKGRKRTKQHKLSVSKSSKNSWNNNKESMLKVVNENLIKAHSKESRNKAAQSNTGKKRTLEQRKVLSEKSKIRNQDPIYINKIKEKLKKNYSLVNPNGEVIHFKGLKDFCLENNLTYSSIKRVISGLYKQHKGWKKNLI